MSDDDLIRREDALAIAKQFAWISPDTEKQIAALRDVQVGVRKLEWENFDAWEYWARSPVGTYYVKERHGVWKATLDKASGNELVYEYTTDGLTPNDFEAAQLAAQADYDDRIRSALTVQPAPEPPRQDTDRVALSKWLQHDGLCGIVGGYGRCTCGLDAAIAVLEGRADD